MFLAISRFEEISTRYQTLRAQIGLSICKFRHPTWMDTMISYNSMIESIRETTILIHRFSTMLLAKVQHCRMSSMPHYEPRKERFRQMAWMFMASTKHYDCDRISRTSWSAPRKERFWFGLNLRIEKSNSFVHTMDNAVVASATKRRKPLWFELYNDILLSFLWSPVIAT